VAGKASGPIKGNGKGLYVLYGTFTQSSSKALRYSTHCQGITQFYLHTLHFTRKRNEEYLPFPTQPQLDPAAGGTHLLTSEEWKAE